MTTNDEGQFNLQWAVARKYAAHCRTLNGWGRECREVPSKRSMAHDAAAMTPDGGHERPTRRDLEAALTLTTKNTSRGLHRSKSSRDWQDIGHSNGQGLRESNRGVALSSWPAAGRDDHRPPPRQGPGRGFVLRALSSGVRHDGSHVLFRPRPTKARERHAGHRYRSRWKAVAAGNRAATPASV